jgi:hypothetical protein
MSQRAVFSLIRGNCRSVMKDRQPCGDGMLQQDGGFVDAGLI